MALVHCVTMWVRGSSFNATYLLLGHDKGTYADSDARDDLSTGMYLADCFRSRLLPEGRIGSTGLTKTGGELFLCGDRARVS